MENLKDHLQKVIDQVQKLQDEGKVPNAAQLESYTKQVVTQLKNLTSRAPAHVRDALSAPWVGDYDFENNTSIPGAEYDARKLLDILVDTKMMLDTLVVPAAATGGGTTAVGGGSSSSSRAGDGVPQHQPPPPAGPAAPTITKSTGQETARTVLQGKQKVQFNKEGSWVQDLSGGQGKSGVTTRRDEAPEISAASMKMPTWEKKDLILMHLPLPDLPSGPVIILSAIRRNRVTVISGDTGCGKSTLIPQLVCDAVNLVPDDKVVVCTQPRRVAAITLPEYVAKDRGQTLGDEVGYQIRFVNEFSEHTRLIYATTAIILRRLHAEPDLESIGCLIVDEVHERDVYTDFLLLLVREAMLKGRMQHLKIVLMSATLNADDFASYFQQVNGADALRPVHIPGRMYKVYDYYWEDACEWLDFCPPAKGAGKGGKKGKGKKGNKGGADDGDKNQFGATERAVMEACERISRDETLAIPRPDRKDEYSQKALSACVLWREKEVYTDLIIDLIMYFHEHEPKGSGAILVFLPGWGDISKIFLQLHSKNKKFKLITLHSLMTPEQQHEAFEPAPSGYRKIVLSTNIAEASVTIDDIVYVIDSGVRKERNYNPVTGVSALDTTMVVHLFPSYKFKSLEEFPTPAMLTSSMEEVVLQSKVIFGATNDDISRMLTSSMAQPSNAAIKDAIDVLKKMNCLTPDAGELTALGRASAAIPISPIHAKMLLLGATFRCLRYAAVAAAFLSIKNPFQTQPGTKGGRDAGKDYFKQDFTSDHVTTIQAYYEWRQAVKNHSGDQFCEAKGLSPEVLDMAHMMINQFLNFMLDAGYDAPDVNQTGDIMDMQPFRKNSPEHHALKCALTGGFWPSACVLYGNGRAPAYWYTMGGESVSAFRGSVNCDYVFESDQRDGDAWMAYSDSMKMGPHNSIMDSTMVTSNYALLFCNCLFVDRVKKEVRFDKWRAKVDDLSRFDEILGLRREIMPAFKDAIEARDLSTFPESLTKRMIAFCTGPVVPLKGIDAGKVSVYDDIANNLRDQLSFFNWPQDDGVEEDEDQEMEGSSVAADAAPGKQLVVLLKGPGRSTGCGPTPSGTGSGEEAKEKQDVGASFLRQEKSLTAFRRFETVSGSCNNELDLGLLPALCRHYLADDPVEEVIFKKDSDPARPRTFLTVGQSWTPLLLFYVRETTLVFADFDPAELLKAAFRTELVARLADEEAVQFLNSSLCLEGWTPSFGEHNGPGRRNIEAAPGGSSSLRSIASKRQKMKNICTEEHDEDNVPSFPSLSTAASLTSTSSTTSSASFGTAGNEQIQIVTEQRPRGHDDLHQGVLDEYQEQTFRNCFLRLVAALRNSKAVVYRHVNLVDDAAALCRDFDFGHLNFSNVLQYVPCNNGEPWRQARECLEEYRFGSPGTSGTSRYFVESYSRSPHGGLSRIFTDWRKYLDWREGGIGDEELDYAAEQEREQDFNADCVISLF
eukprot:g11908.t1